MAILQVIPPLIPPLIPTSAATLVDDYWANFLGCELAQLNGDGTVYQLTGVQHQGIWAIARHRSWVVITPASWPSELCAQLYRCFQPDVMPDSVQLQRLLDQIGNQQLYGPALIMLHGQTNGPDKISPLVRPLTAADYAQIAAFQAAAHPIFWSLAEPASWPKIFGVFVEGQLVAACGVRLWGDLLAELYIDTVPAHWRRGYGKAATDAALRWIHTETAYQAESVVELANVASWRLMHNVGFLPYAYMLTSFVTA